MQKCGMAKLDNDDLKAIKDLVEVTVEEMEMGALSGNFAKKSSGWIRYSAKAAEEYQGLNISQIRHGSTAKMKGEISLLLLNS